MYYVSFIENFYDIPFIFKDLILRVLCMAYTCNTCYNLVTVKGTQVHLTTTNTTTHKERTYTMSIDNLLDLIIQYKEAAQLIETAQAEQETIKAQIKAEMAHRNTNDLQVGCHKVKLSDFTSTRLDSKAIKAVAPALFTQYSKVVTGQRLTIN